MVFAAERRGALAPLFLYVSVSDCPDFILLGGERELQLPRTSLALQRLGEVRNREVLSRAASAGAQRATSDHPPVF